MHRLLLVVAVAVGCGDVGAPPDALPAVDLRKGCAMKALMDEASWLGTGRPVLNACGTSTGAVVGTGPDTTDSDRGRVGSFSGEACVDFPNTAELHGTTGLTMSAWVRPTGLNGVDSNGVISKRNDRNKESEYGLFVWTGSKVYIDLGDSDRYVGTAALMNNNMWSRLTAVFDSSRTGTDQVRLFINGVADPLQHVTIGNLGDSLPAYDSPLHLGCTPAPTADPPTQQTFRGQLDDITIWNRALSDAELAALFAGP